MSDSQILEAMRNKELDDYLKQSLNDDYNKCFKDIDNQSSHILSELIYVVKMYSDKYKIDELKILREMIYPALQEGVAQ
ncbi:MAG: hypothetical protein EOM05_09820 [Clostridia bacterium]|nr:hypothetical protein [Clostridia bacterium]